MRALISIAHDAPGILAIRDLNTGAMSVTNDAEAVVFYLWKNNSLEDRRLIYQDSEGAWDEILHSAGTFIGFHVLGSDSLERAMAKIRPQIYSVDIFSTKDEAVPVEKIYSGPSYQDAFDYATKARSNEMWRGKLIRFATPEAVKWAEIR